ncbi:MAG: MBL fold metallo-hydrolase [Bacteroidales bacterium]|nr:MBL fold metallo-hydrolase [Bacteroidales bacterium]
MKITILTENFAGSRFLSEHGFSYFIEYEGFKLLWDTGATDIFLQNAKRLNIDIDEVETVALSHGHWDHGDGLRFLKNKTVITHPNTFIKRYRRLNNEYLGLNQTIDQVRENFNLILSDKPHFITENIVFLGEIPRKFGFEQWNTPYIDEFGKDDLITDDSALVAILDEELVIVAGCSHSGICNIIEYAKKVTGIFKINTVIGGFHLKKADERTKKTIEYFKEQKVKNIMPSHCTQLPALVEFYKEFEIIQVKTGNEYVF